MMKVARRLATGLWLLGACRPGEGRITEPPPGNHEQMVIENIPYEALGSTKLTFRREEGEHRRGIVSLDGSSRTAAITYSPWGSTFVAASPNSPRLVYEGYLEPSPSQQRSADIFVMDWGAETGTALGGSGGVRHDPSWSPDGNRVLYGEHTDRSDLFSNRIVIQSPVPGSTNRQILWSATTVCERVEHPRQTGAGTLIFVYTTADPPSCFVERTGIARKTAGGALELVYAPGPYLFSPTWSPSGTEIAFLEPGGTGGATNVSVKRMLADGSNVQTVAVVPQNGSHHWYDFSMCWPGDGSRIYFSVADAQGESHIYAVAVASGTVTKITTAAGARDWSLSC